MKRFTFHQILCLTLVPLMSTTLMAADAGGAMVYVSGATSVNGAATMHSSAVFPGDTIRTSSSSQAKINSSGASVTVFENSSVKFESAGVSIQDGSVNIGSYKKELNAKAGDVTVTPASNDWTEFELSHRNGAVQIIARKGDVHINEGTETVTLVEGHSTTRDDSATSDDSNRDERGKEKKKRRDGAAGPAPAASNPTLDSPVWIGVGSGAILGGLIYALTQSGEPVSPITP